MSDAGVLPLVRLYHISQSPTHIPREMNFLHYVLIQTVIWTDTRYPRRAGIQGIEACLSGETGMITIITFFPVHIIFF